MAEANTITLTRENFDAVINGEKPVLVDFWASWCGPCRAVAPVIDEISAEFSGKIVVGKVNVDEEAELVQRYKIMSIPTIIMFKNGQAVEKIIGARQKNDFVDMINRNL